MLTKEKIEYYYRKGLWTRRQVLDAVSRGCLTKDDAAAILEESTEEVRV